MLLRMMLHLFDRVAIGGDPVYRIKLFRYVKTRWEILEKALQPCFHSTHVERRLATLLRNPEERGD